MTIGTVSSSLKEASVPGEAQVKLINSQKKQEEAVVSKVLEGVKDQPRLEGQTGHNLNVTA